MPWPLGVTPTLSRLGERLCHSSALGRQDRRRVTSAGVCIQPLPRIPGGSRVRPGGHCAGAPALHVLCQRRKRHGLGRRAGAHLAG